MQCSPERQQVGWGGESWTTSHGFGGRNLQIKPIQQQQKETKSMSQSKEMKMRYSETRYASPLFIVDHSPIIFPTRGNTKFFLSFRGMGPYHLFDGEGRLHSVRIFGGRAVLCSRYVNIGAQCTVERDAGHPILPNVFPGFNGLTRPDEVRFPTMPARSTSIINRCLSRSCTDRALLFHGRPRRPSQP